MLKTNSEKLIQMSVLGKAHHPEVGSPYRIDREGKAHVLSATGGIVYNVQIGDPAMGWESDHTEPGVTIRNEHPPANMALNVYSCIGNSARVISGEAKGAKGYATGTHGGVEHVMVYLKPDDLDLLALGDKIQIKSFGVGLKLLDYPHISVFNIDPSLLQKLGIQEVNNKLQVPVTSIVPSYLMGSGVGAPTVARGDYDIMTTDQEEIKRSGLDKLKMGDLVLLKDCDNRYGRAYQKGAVSIGVVIHGDSIKMGHGPGVATILSSINGDLEGVIDPNANIAVHLRD